MVSQKSMAKHYDVLDSELQSWLARQRVFFVASAPLNRDGHINCSPKGGDTFRVLGEREIAYLDLTGSGVETIAHIQENGRIVIMFCAFDGPPKIVRLHGIGEVVYPHHDAYAALRAHFAPHDGARAVVRVRLNRISDSCGYAVPLFDFSAPRDTLDRWTESKGTKGLIAYRAQKNRESIDGLPGYKNG
jgi:hypothetical protein